MRTKNIFLIVLLIAAAVGIGWALKQPFIPIIQQSPKDIYYCPMHPHYTSDHPGNCPICGMKLVKKENHAQEVAVSAPGSVLKIPTGYATVSIDTQKQQLIGIKTILVAKKNLVKTIRAYGYVAHDLELYNAQLEYIDAWRIYYSFQSRRPIKGASRTDWKEYYIKPPTENRWRSDEKVKAQQRFVKAEYELVHMGLTEEQIAQLREIKYGQPWVQPDLLFFGKDQPFWIYSQVLESDLGFIAAGQKVVATIPIYGETVEGVVRSVSPVIDPVTRTSRVRIELPTYKGELSVNMYVNVDMPVELDEALVIPREAIMDTGLNKIVFVQTKPGVFEPRSIQTGLDGNGMVAVKSGLKEGETIVVSGNFLIDSESRLEGSLTGGQ